MLKKLSLFVLITVGTAAFAGAYPTFTPISDRRTVQSLEKQLSEILEEGVVIDGVVENHYSPATVLFTVNKAHKFECLVTKGRLRIMVHDCISRTAVIEVNIQIPYADLRIQPPGRESTGMNFLPGYVDPSAIQEQIN